MKFSFDSICCRIFSPAPVGFRHSIPQIGQFKLFKKYLTLAFNVKKISIKCAYLLVQSLSQSYFTSAINLTKIESHAIWFSTLVYVSNKSISYVDMNQYSLYLLLLSATKHSYLISNNTIN